jgi:CLIP-associating protein 1/2
MMIMESIHAEESCVLALQVMGQLLRTQPEGFHDYMDVVIHRLIERFKSPDNSRDVSHQAERTLELLVKTIDPHRCLAVLTPLLMSEEGPALQVVVLSQLMTDRLLLAVLTSCFFRPM